MVQMTKTYEFVLDEVQINHIKEALLGARYAVASITEEQKPKTDEELEDKDTGEDIVEELDELIKLFNELDSRVEKNEISHIRCCVIPKEKEES